MSCEAIEGLAFLMLTRVHLSDFPFFTQVKETPFVTCFKPTFEHRPPADAAIDDCAPIEVKRTDSEIAAMEIFFANMYATIPSTIKGTTVFKDADACFWLLFDQTIPRNSGNWNSVAKFNSSPDARGDFPANPSLEFSAQRPVCPSVS